MDSTTFRKSPIAGEYGDACTFTAKFTFASSAIGTRVEWAKLPAGTELIEVTLINDALGASTTLGIGELFDKAADGTTAAASLGAAASTATAGRRESAFHPRIYNSDVTITSTVAGAAATGVVSAIIKYRYVGI